MKAVKYPESIFCAACEENVKMTDCRVANGKPKSKVQIEFDYVCVTCGHRASATRDWEFLQYSEREFCQKQGVPDFAAKPKGLGVVYDKLPTGRR